MLLQHTLGSDVALKDCLCVHLSKLTLYRFIDKLRIAGDIPIAGNDTSKIAW